MKSHRHVIMFQSRFAALVESGAKCQTIRPRRKRVIEYGDVLDLRTWTGKPYRSKQRGLREGKQVRVEGIIIHINSVEFAPGTLRATCWFKGQPGGLDKLNWFARSDGFMDWAEMRDWFANTHELPFEGQLIRWNL